MHLVCGQVLRPPRSVGGGYGTRRLQGLTVRWHAEHKFDDVIFVTIDKWRKKLNYSQIKIDRIHSRLVILIIVSLSKVVDCLTKTLNHLFQCGKHLIASKRQPSPANCVSPEIMQEYSKALTDFNGMQPSR